MREPCAARFESRRRENSQRRRSPSATSSVFTSHSFFNFCINVRLRVNSSMAFAASSWSYRNGKLAIHSRSPGFCVSSAKRASVKSERQWLLSIGLSPVLLGVAAGNSRNWLRRRVPCKPSPVVWRRALRGGTRCDRGSRFSLTRRGASIFRSHCHPIVLKRGNHSGIHDQDLGVLEPGRKRRRVSFENPNMMARIPQANEQTQTGMALGCCPASGGLPCALPRMPVLAIIAMFAGRSEGISGNFGTRASIAAERGGTGKTMANGELRTDESDTALVG